MAKPGPLTGVRVLDLTRALAGPLCATTLSDLGATVIKVENMPGGDPSRDWPPFHHERSLYFESVNRGKRSLVLDFRTVEGKDVLRSMIAESDVVVENFRPGLMKEMGFDPERLREQHPELIITSISGFGTTGPDRDAAGLDQVAQGMSGLISITGSDPDHTFRFGVPIVDILAGLFAVVGTLAALSARSGGAGGARVETSLLEAGISALVFQAQQYLELGDVAKPQGNMHPVLQPYGTYQTKDAPLVIAVANDRQWVAFCGVLGSPELAHREEFRTSTARLQNRDQLTTEIEQRLKTRLSGEWLAAIRSAGIPAGPIYTIDQVFADRQVSALGMVQELPIGQDSSRPMLRSPLSIDGEHLPVVSVAPDYGAHSIEILNQIGMSHEEIQQLLASGFAYQSGRPK